VANLIKKTLFERPSQPQSAPLGKVPLGLVEVLDFYSAWNSQQTQSFRVADREPLQHRYFTQPDFAWISEALGLNFDVNTTNAARQQLLDSFRLWDTLPLDKFERPDFPQSAPLGKVPLGLVEVLDFIAAWRDQTQAFRSKLPAGDRFYILDTQPAFSWLAIPINLLDLFTIPKFPAIYSQTQSIQCAMGSPYL